MNTHDNCRRERPGFPELLVLLALTSRTPLAAEHLQQLVAARTAPLQAAAATLWTAAASRVPPAGAPSGHVLAAATR